MAAASTQAGFVPRLVCSRCARPQSVCLCSAIVEIETRTRIVILQHPRESAVPVNTARIAELGLPRCERHVGVVFGDATAVRAALSDPEAPAILLFPGEGARDLTREPPAGPVTLVVIDGTWWQASKILKRNPELARLPRYAFDPLEPSRYRIRREPARHCVSTIEAITAALSVLETESSGLRRLLGPFDALVEQQLGFAERGVRRHVKKPSRRRVPASVSELRARSGDLVVGYGEANAWPRGTPLGATPELVHWAAERLATGERFEAFLRPGLPLSPSLGHHTGLAAADVTTGELRISFSERWAAFLRPSDLLCGWGYFSSELLQATGAVLPERADVRLAARRLLRHSPGTVEECVSALGQSAPPAAWVKGRTGVRLAALAAVTRALCAVES